MTGRGVEVIEAPEARLAATSCLGTTGNTPWFGGVRGAAFFILAGGKYVEFRGEFDFPRVGLNLAG